MKFLPQALPLFFEVINWNLVVHPEVKELVSERYMLSDSDRPPRPLVDFSLCNLTLQLHPPSPIPFAVTLFRSISARLVAVTVKTDNCQSFRRCVQGLNKYPGLQLLQVRAPRLCTCPQSAASACALLICNPCHQNKGLFQTLFFNQHRLEPTYPFDKRLLLLSSPSAKKKRH